MTISLSAETIWTVTKTAGFWSMLSERISQAFLQENSNLSIASNRQIIHVSSKFGLGVMAGITTRQSPLAGVKVVLLNHSSKQSHPGSIILFNESTGEPSALLEANSITAIRTAATTLAATTLLHPNATKFTIIGTGIEAQSHIAAYISAFPEATFTIWGKNHSSALSLASKYTSTEIDIRAECDLPIAIKDAHVLTSLTSAKVPFIPLENIDHNAHINAIGASVQGLAEWPSDLFTQAKLLVCDNVKECRMQSGEIPEVGYRSAVNFSKALLSEPRKGSVQRTGITIFKSVGSAITDVVTSSLILELLDLQLYDDTTQPILI